MAPYNSEWVENKSYGKSEKSLAVHHFRNVLGDLGRNYREVYDKGFDSEREVFYFAKNPLYLEYFIPKAGNKLSEMELNPKFFEIYYKDARGRLAILGQLFEVNRKEFSFFADYELNTVVTKGSDVFPKNEGISEEQIHHFMNENYDCYCFLDDTDEKNNYYIYLRAGWEPLKEQNKVLNEFYKIEDISLPLLSKSEIKEDRV